MKGYWPELTRNVSKVIKIVLIKLIIGPFTYMRLHQLVTHRLIPLSQDFSNEGTPLNKVLCRRFKVTFINL